MSEENKPQGEGAPDPTSELKTMIESLNQSVVNLKAEMNRKIEQVRAPQPTSSVKDDKTLAELMYENPEEAVNKITANVTQQVAGIFEKREKTRDAVNKIYTDYPELTDPNSPLSKEAQKKFSELSESDKVDPRALKAAVLEAAVELGLPPVTKRKATQKSDDTDNFSLGGDSSRPQRRSQKKEELSESTLQAAKLMGLDVNDPKVVESLKSRAKRGYKNYGE